MRGPNGELIAYRDKLGHDRRGGVSLPGTLELRDTRPAASCR